MFQICFSWGFGCFCEENPTVTSGFPSQWASNVENVSISWRLHGYNALHMFIFSSSFTDFWFMYILSDQIWNEIPKDMWWNVMVLHVLLFDITHAKVHDL